MTTTETAPTISEYARDFRALSAENGVAPWLIEMRNSAWADFERLGFPTHRKGNELWKYTDLRVLDSTAFRRSRDHDSRVDAVDDLKKIAPWHDGWHTAVSVDGRFAPGLSANTAATGFTLCELVTTPADLQPAVRSVLGKIAATEDNPFVALNTSMIDSGVVVSIAPGAIIEDPIHLLHIVTAGPEHRSFFPRHLVIAGAGSSASIIETYINLSDGGQLTVPVFEVSLAENALVRHFRVQLENDDSIHIGFTRTEQQANAVFESTTFATGPALGRNDVHTNLAGEGAETTLHGLYVTDGSSHQDNEISTTHQLPHGTSHQFYKGILAGKSRAVFSGKVVVKPGAMKTLADQKDLNLLLSHGAEIDTKPSLEIYADDVKCAHGATAGHVDQDMLFYLMSRGVSREAAAMMLITGFASEIVDEFEPGELRDFLYEKLERIIPELDSEGIL